MSAVKLQIIVGDVITTEFGEKAKVEKVLSNGVIECSGNPKGVRITHVNDIPFDQWYLRITE